ncbi:hypothetical protein GALMADRAFT_142258 [Galerina marginata CBS 339.88]|uniref:Uncharacterized protein n=1 Tax=Galerina marginata (strain CBS 339.88) TaxID=685588 RepID=A0A067SZJ6_GALM3|nr:hypothetical protein GALMADRAFT_142258 [Galerina marginata CBS 339.88]
MTKRPQLVWDVPGPSFISSATELGPIHLASSLHETTHPTPPTPVRQPTPTPFRHVDESDEDQDVSDDEDEDMRYTDPPLSSPVPEHAVLTFVDAVYLDCDFHDGLTGHRTVFELEFVSAFASSPVFQRGPL